MSEWLSEPDAVDFEAHGYRCALRRGPMGHWCGYIGLPAGHPWHGLHYDAQVPGKIADDTTIDDVGVITAFCGSLHMTDTHASLSLLVPCHGGLTYADRGEHIEKNSALWWLGFDAGHSGDLCPQSIRRGFFGETEVYRDEAYMRASCERAAATIAKLTDAPVTP